ncbi:MAG: lipocalin family protein [Granulosicoccus sp.]
MSKMSTDRGLARLLPLLMLLLVSACGNNGNSADMANMGKPDAQWQSVLDALELPDDPVADAVIPDDIRAHPESPFESFEMRAVLRNEAGQWLGLSAQIDRLQVTSQSNAQSAWAFDSIARASISGAGQSSAMLATREELSRVALNLANSRPEEIHVRDTRFSFGDKGACTRSIHAQGRDARNKTYLLSAEPSTCPQAVSSGFLNQWEFPAMSVQGRYASEAVTGHMWLTHRWGSAVLPGGVVLLDQARIQLLIENKMSLLTVNRTKRASGRGPRTVEAFISEDRTKFKSVKVEWEDQGLQTSTTTELSYPITVVLKIPSKGFELTLQPVVTLSEVQDSMGSRWSGGVIVSGIGAEAGTLSGTGFLDFQPLSLKK